MNINIPALINFDPAGIKKHLHVYFRPARYYAV
ncbi:Uncharacterised protein [Citrobacter freundii]|nr:Uncharacterised protein [Citrobacter freundii]